MEQLQKAKKYENRTNMSFYPRVPSKYNDMVLLMHWYLKTIYVRKLENMFVCKLCKIDQNTVLQH